MINVILSLRDLDGDLFLPIHTQHTVHLCPNVRDCTRAGTEGFARKAEVLACVTGLLHHHLRVTMWDDSGAVTCSC